MLTLKGLFSPSVCKQATRKLSKSPELPCFLIRMRVEHNSFWNCLACSELRWATELEDVDYARGGAPDALKPKKEKVREDAQDGSAGI